LIKTQTREIYIKILVFTGLITISILAMRPVHIALTAAMSHIRTNFIEKIESLTGIEIKYSSIRPNFFGSFDIRNLSLIKNNKPFLSVSRVRISFSLLELLKGKKAVFHGIRLEHPSITLDLQEDKDTFEFLASLKNDEKKTNKEVLSQVAQFFPGKTELRIRDCFIGITDRARKYQIQNMNIDVTGNGEQLSFNGDLNAEFIYSGLFNRIYSLNGDMHASGVCSAGFDEGSAKLDFSSISGSEQEIVRKKASFLRPLAQESKNTKEYFTVQPLNFTLDYKDGIFTLNIGDNLPFGGFVYYNTASKGVATEVNCKNFLLGDFVKLSGKHNDLNRIFFMPVTGEASFYSAGSAMRYRAEFQGSDAQNNSFEFKTHGNDKYIAFEKIRLFAPYNKKTDNFFSGELDITGRIGFNPITSSGSIAFNKFSLGTDEFINAFFSVSTLKNEIQITGENVAAGQLTLDNFNIYLTPSDKDLSIAVSLEAETEKTIDLFAALNYPQKAPDSSNQGSANQDPANFEVSATVNSFSVFDLMQMASPFSKKVVIPPIVKKHLADSSITTEIFLTTDFNQIVYNVPNMVFASQDVKGVFSFAGNDRMFTLSESVITKNGTDLIVSAQYNFANPADVSFILNAKYQDLSWNVEGQLIDKTTLIIRDKNGLRVYGSASNSGGISGYMEGVDFPFLVNNKTVYLNFYLTLRYTSNNFWFVDIAKFNAREINSSKGINYISFSGAVDNDGASFRNLLISDNIGDLAGTVNFSWDTDFSYLNFLINLTDGRENGENYSAEGVVKRNHFDVLANVSDMRLDRLLKNDKNGKGTGPVYLSGQAEIKGDSIKSFTAKCGLESLYLKNNDVKASGNVLFTNDQFTATDLKFEYKKVKLQMPELQLNRAESYAKINGEIQGVVMKKWLQSNFEINADFKDIDSWLEITQAVESINGSFKAEKILFGLEDFDPFSFLFSSNNGAVFVSGGPKNMLKFEMDKGGNFFTSLSSPFPIRSTIVGKYKDGFIDAHCNDLYMDLSGIWEFTAEIPDFVITGGYVTGNVDIRGPILDPEFYGTARGTSFRFLVPKYIGHDIKPVPFNAVLEGNEIVFGPVSAAVGSGGGTVSGWLRFEKWIPENVSIEVTVPRNTPIPYKFNITGFIAKGDASGRVNILHENRTLDISGNILANNTELGINFDELMQSRYETEKPAPEPPTTVNLSVTTGPVVEFIWPNTSSPILRANPEIGTVMTVYADTLAGQYTINSDISIRSGEMYYFDRNFYIRHGVLVFRENEQQFNPRITARAEIRERTDSGPVTVSMIIDNESLLSFVPRFESVPSLTQLEIYSLLGHSMYLAGGNETGDEAARFLISSTTDILSKVFANSELGQITGLRRFERTLRSLLFLDMFSVRTKILQNAVASNVGQGKFEKNISISNYFDNTTVYAGKYIGQDMFIQSMLRLRYDENSLTMGGLRIEPDIGIEFNTPLFNIRWDFLPESYNPENWGIKDNSITLIWSKSF
jgi:translocation and assembly module TamB